jgi:hypothetical protein
MVLLLCWCLGLASAQEPDGQAWVLAGDPAHRPLKSALRRLDRRAAIAVTPTVAGRWCVTFDDPPPADLRRKATRWLGAEPEVRLDCTVAAYPLGRGWLAYIIAGPASGLEEALPRLVESHSLYQRMVHRPSDDTQPTRLCVSALGITDPRVLSRALGDEGLVVDAIYEVGGCQRR